MGNICSVTLCNTPNCFRPIADQVAAEARRGIMVNPATKEIKKTKVRGKVAIVTGCTAGLGKYTCKVLCRSGMHVIMTGRSRTRLKNAEKDIRLQVKDANITTCKVDLASFQSIRDFVDNFIDLNLPLHLLVNNAGIMACPYGITMDGLEKQLETNYVGHFYLTLLLMPKLRSSGPGRIVNVSSSYHVFAEPMNLDLINPKKEDYDRFIQYCRSKACMILHARKLARELKDDNIACFSVHPGMVATAHKDRWMPCEALYGASCLCLKSIGQGAATTIYCCLQPNIERFSGGYFADCALTAPAAFCRDVRLEDDLWRRSEKFCSRALAAWDQHNLKHQNLIDDDTYTELESSIIKQVTNVKKLLQKVVPVAVKFILHREIERDEEEEEKETSAPMGRIRFADEEKEEKESDAEIAAREAKAKEAKAQQEVDKKACQDSLAEAIRLASLQEF